MIQKEADDALVFAEKEDLLTEISTAEFSEHGLRMKGYQIDIINTTLHHVGPYGSH